MRDGRLVGFAAGGDEQHAIELARRQFGQQRGQVDDRARQDGGIEVVELADGAAHDLDDLGMAVADDGAHLPRAEIEDAPALRVPHEAALRALGDERRELAAVAHQMGPRLLPERRVGVARPGLAHIVHAALLGCSCGNRSAEETVHFDVQIMASAASGARSLSPHPRLGLSFSIVAPLAMWSRIANLSMVPGTE